MVVRVLDMGDDVCLKEVINKLDDFIGDMNMDLEKNKSKSDKKTLNRSGKDDEKQDVDFKSGFGFIRSRKSPDKIHKMAYEMMCRAKQLGINLEKIIVDDGGSCDIDRRCIDEVKDYIESDQYDVFMIRRESDITSDYDDYCQFEHCAKCNAVSIVSLNTSYPDVKI